MLPSSAPVDIEELCTAAEQATVCPYFLMKKRVKKASIVLAPYNYLIDPAVRKAMKLPVKDSIVVFDEVKKKNKGLLRDTT